MKIIVIGLMLGLIALGLQSPDLVRLSRLEARVTLLTEQVKQLSLACEGGSIKEYRWESGVGKFVCRSCRIEEDPR